MSPSAEAAFLPYLINLCRRGVEIDDGDAWTVEEAEKPPNWAQKRFPEPFKYVGRYYQEWTIEKNGMVFDVVGRVFGIKWHLQDYRIYFVIDDVNGLVD